MDRKSFCGGVILVALLHASWPLKAGGPDLFIQAGVGGDGDLRGLGFVSFRGRVSSTVGEKLILDSHLETSITQLRGDGRDARSLWVAALTPVFRLSAQGAPLFIEVGVGLTYFDRKRLSSSNEVGTHFEFGDILGFGFRFGNQDRYELGYRWIHYSNAGISSNNPGLDFHALRLRADF